MSDKIRQLEDQCAKLATDLREITEIESPTAEDEQRFDKVSDELTSVEKKIAMARKAKEAEDRANERVESRAAHQGMSVEAVVEQDEAEKRDAVGEFREWCLGNDIGELRGNKLTTRLYKDAREARAETDPQATTSTVGGEYIPQGFRNALEVAMLAYGGVRSVATVLRTADGGALPMPTHNDTDQKGALLAENTQDAVQKIDTSSVTLNAYKYTSKIVQISKELLQDDAFDTAAWVGNALGERLARIHNQHFTTGTGSSQPNGIVTAATLGVTAAGASAIDFDDLIDLQHSVDPAYRNGASWMFNDATLKVIRKLKDSNGQYIWDAGTPANGVPGSVLGQRYTINQDMASIGGSTKPVLYGDFSKYMVRDVLAIDLVRLVERYADYHQVAFVAITRNDADLLDAGTNPVKYLAMESA